MGFEADLSGTASSEGGRLRQEPSECEAGEQKSLPAACLTAVRAGRPSSPLNIKDMQDIQFLHIFFILRVFFNDAWHKNGTVVSPRHVYPFCVRTYLLS
jgi:hypothetical protein